MNERPSDFFLSEGPLRPGDAAVALIVLDDLRYLMQLRDQKPGIFYPGHWGLFGGGIDPGESRKTGCGVSYSKNSAWKRNPSLISRDFPLTFPVAARSRWSGIITK